MMKHQHRHRLNISPAAEDANKPCVSPLSHMNTWLTFSFVLKKLLLVTLLRRYQVSNMLTLFFILFTFVIGKRNTPLVFLCRCSVTCVRFKEQSLLSSRAKYWLTQPSTHSLPLSPSLSLCKMYSPLPTADVFAYALRRTSLYICMRLLLIISYTQWSSSLTLTHSLCLSLYP